MSREPASPAAAWFVRPRRAPDAAARLICFPHAGGAASAYYTWAAALPGIDVVAVQPPGREARLREAPLIDGAQLVRALADAVAGEIDRPTLFFGHSMGALVAYEVARELSRRGAPLPVHLFASGRRSPTVPDHEPPLHRLPDREFVAELERRFGGMPAAITAEPELLALFLPVIRADVTLLETYPFVAGEPLDVPITVFGGEHDHQTSPSLLAAWQSLSAFPVAVRQFTGGHFFLHERRSEFLPALADEIARALAARRSA